MNQNERVFSVTTLLIALAVAAGALVRFANLGQNPLDANEATLALQAFHTAQGHASTWGGHPLYLGLTTALFYFCGSSTLLARLIPALFGVAFLVLPACYSKQLRPGAVVILSWLLALDPSLIAASRTAGSWMTSLTLLGFLFVAVKENKTWAAAILLALCLLSGPTLWPILVLAAVSLFLWSRGFPGQTLAFRPADFKISRPFWFVFLVSFLGFASMMIFTPNGISAFGASFIEVKGLITNSQPSSLILTALALPIYSPVVFVAGFIQGILAAKARDRIGVLAFVYVLVTGLVILVLPGRQPLMLTWLIVPLAYLASLAIDKILSYAAFDFKQPGLIAGFVVLILIFLWQVFGSINQGRVEMNQFLLYSGAGIVILLVCAILAILGWSVKVTGIGYAWGFLLIFSLYTISAAWHSSGISSATSKEFWNFGETPSQVELVKKTVSEVSSTVRGVNNGLDVYALGSISPALEWQLRDQNLLRVMSISYENAPGLVISPVDTSIDPTQFRGQDFVLRSRMDWSSLTVQDWMKWIMIRSIEPVNVEDCILWVRWDIFPGYRPTLVPAE